jgi:hypothetical protein
VPQDCQKQVLCRPCDRPAPLPGALHCWAIHQPRRCFAPLPAAAAACCSPTISQPHCPQLLRATRCLGRSPAASSGAPALRNHPGQSHAADQPPRLAHLAARRCNPTAISLKAGCELFLRYTTRTSSLEFDDFGTAKARLIEVGARAAAGCRRRRRRVLALHMPQLTGPQVSCSCPPAAAPPRLCPPCSGSHSTQHLAAARSGPAALRPPLRAPIPHALPTAPLAP